MPRIEAQFGSNDYRHGLQTQLKVATSQLNTRTTAIDLATNNAGRVQGIMAYANGDMALPDINFDGKLSAAELKAANSSHYIAGDLNGDGDLQLEELEALIAFQTNPVDFARQAIAALPQNQQAAAQRTLQTIIDNVNKDKTISAHNADNSTDHLITPREAEISQQLMRQLPAISTSAIRLADNAFIAPAK